MNRRTFFRRALCGTPFAALGTAGYSRFVERHAVQVVPVDVALGIGEPLTVAFLSDFHFDPLYETDYLEHVVAETTAARPDLVLFGGDFVSNTTDRLPELIDILGKTEAPSGKFTVLGNHDHWIAPDEIAEHLMAAKIRVLRSETVALPDRPGWFLTGIESFWAGRPNTRSLEATPTDSRHLVLVHEPDSFDRLTDPRIAIQISGHTHGGQIRPPGVGALQLPRWGQRYDAGLFEVDGRRLYVNRGIGTVGHHYRLNCRPEITLFRLT
jgi:predicted MPP superfamily phosphohydrolase